MVVAGAGALGFGPGPIAMDIPDGYSDIPAGKIATVVTHLQLCQRPSLRPEHPQDSWVLRKTNWPDLDQYRALFRRIGEDLFWFSRLRLNDDQLRERFSAPPYEAYVFEAAGREEGIMELDFGVEGECQLAFFGLTPTMVGRGAGRWMMNRALEIAWSRPIRRMWVHTCSLDHPDALDFYVRSEFEPFRRQIEVYDDPRITGLLPRDAAPRVPII